MQEPPNESDASVSTLIIVFFTRCLLHLPVLFIYTVWIRILGQNILINQSKSTEHKFGGLEALPSCSVETAPLEYTVNHAPPSYNYNIIIYLYMCIIHKRSYQYIIIDPFRVR